MEEWKDFGFCQVSTSGHVRCDGQDLEPVGGLVSIQGKLYQVGRLVAQAFLRNPEGYTTLRHRDRDPRNNFLWNLEWTQ